MPLYDSSKPPKLSRNQCKINKIENLKILKIHMSEALGKLQNKVSRNMYENNLKFMKTDSHVDSLSESHVKITNTRKHIHKLLVFI